MTNVFVTCTPNSSVFLKGDGDLDVKGAGVARLNEVDGEMRIRHPATSKNAQIILHTGESVEFELYGDNYAIVPNGYGLRAEIEGRGDNRERIVRVVPLE